MGVLSSSNAKQWTLGSAFFVICICCFFLAGGTAAARQLNSGNSSNPGRDQIRRNLLDNGLGLTPQMGWNSWNHFNCHIKEKLIRETADAM
ncbi:unnamed protein product, partial [Ilex paraguariensis]